MSNDFGVKPGESDPVRMLGLMLLILLSFIAVGAVATAIILLWRVL